MAVDFDVLDALGKRLEAGEADTPDNWDAMATELDDLEEPTKGLAAEMLALYRPAEDEALVTANTLAGTAARGTRAKPSKGKGRTKK